MILIIILKLFCKVRLLTMLTYSLHTSSKIPLYEQLYQAIKIDILEGKLKSNEKLPSKRNFSKHLGISVVTIETSYQQLQAE